MSRLFSRRPSPSMVVALCALFVALGGTSYAALNIGSAQITNNSVQSKDIKNGTVVNKDIKASTRLSLRGQRGAAGAAGAAGAPGAAGPRGPSDARFAESGSDVIGFTAGVEQLVQTLDIPAGKWVIQSKVLANNNANGANPTVNCNLKSGTTVIDDGFDGAKVGDQATDDREYFTYFGVTDVPAPTAVTLNCTTNGATGNWLNRRIVAIQVASLG